MRYADDVRDLLSEWTRSRTVAQILDILGGHVAVGPVHNAADLFHDRHLVARNMIVEVEQRAPFLGEHGDEVLTSLGYTAAQISELHRVGAVGTQRDGGAQSGPVTVG
jgi:crotonobetainyl-CoA:carnitine CoA-transferase CaiB-like acyl-CoA transferase